MTGFRRFWILSSACLALALVVGSSGPVLAQGTGTLYFSEDSNPNGLFTLNTSTGAATLVESGATGVNSLTVGLTESANPALLYGSSWVNLHHINAHGSGFVNVGPINAEGLAFDPTGNLLYAALNGAFRSHNPANGSLVANLASPNADVEGLAFGNGLVYGLAGAGAGMTGDLFAYNIGSNSWSRIGNTGVQFSGAGLAFDPFSNILYAKGNQNQNLYRIDPVTAAATIVGPTGRMQGGGLAFVPIPEPSSITLLGLGLTGFIGYGWRRRRRTA